MTISNFKEHPLKLLTISLHNNPLLPKKANPNSKKLSNPIKNLNPKLSLNKTLTSKKSNLLKSKNNLQIKVISPKIKKKKKTILK